MKITTFAQQFTQFASTNVQACYNLNDKQTAIENLQKRINET